MVHELNIPTCSTSQKAADAPLFAHLIMPVSATDFRDFLDEVDELVQLAPEILEAIENDLDTHTLAKRRLRMADRKFLDGRTDELPELDICECNRLAKELSLAVGRPRMAGFSVFVFPMLRGFLGSLTTKTAGRFLSESMSLHAFLQFRGLKLPAWTTILENVNLVSLATRELIFERQIKNLVLENLDDFQQLTIDSTAVKANSSWPTDGKILTGLLGRAHRLGQKFHLFGLANFRKGWVPRWLSEMEKLEFKICLAAGKAKSRGKLKKYCRQLLGRAEKAVVSLGGELARFEKGLEEGMLAPSRRELQKRIREQICNDVADAQRVIAYARDRVYHDRHLPSTEKVLSLSDGSAAYIKRGERNPLIGYKPQLVRSANGFVTSLIVPEGNAADAIQLEPAIHSSIRRTGVMPKLVSTDDGYASAKGRDELLNMGVKIISISGAKGKKLTGLEDWESEVYCDARRNRSAVVGSMQFEMNCLKKFWPTTAAAGTR